MRLRILFCIAVGLSLTLVFSVSGASAGVISMTGNIALSADGFSFGGGGPNALVNDSFAYDPSDPTGVLPLQDPAGNTFFHSGGGGGSAVLDVTSGVNVDSTASELAFLDMYGRFVPDQFVGEQSRHQNLTIEFYDDDGAAGLGTPVHTVVGFNGISAGGVSSPLPRAYGRLAVPAGVSFDRVRIAKTGDYFVLYEVAVGTVAVIPEPSTGIMAILGLTSLVTFARKRRR